MDFSQRKNKFRIPLNLEFPINFETLDLKKKVRDALR